MSSLDDHLTSFLTGNLDQVDVNVVDALGQYSRENHDKYDAVLSKYIDEHKRDEKSLNPVTVNYSCYSLGSVGYKLKTICDAFTASKFTPNKFPTSVSRIDDCTLLSYPKRRTKVCDHQFLTNITGCGHQV